MRNTVLIGLIALFGVSLLFLPVLRAHFPGTDSVNVEIVPESGAAYLVIPFRDFTKDGSRIVKRYLEARKGENYRIVIRNRTADRIGVVVAVDGRNVITGGRSDLKGQETKYIVDPYGSCSIAGWRTAMDSVHEFFFTSAADSYSSRTFNDASAMGVIGVAVYREKQVQRERISAAEREEAPASARGPVEKKTKSADSAGTGFGGQRYSPAVRVAFEPECTASVKYLFKYEWRETLCEMGVIDCGGDLRNRLWDEPEFAPFPPGYERR